ncbi:putative WD repeat-containing protein slr0143 [Planktothrix tepida]|uniref:Uncharacterized protein n=1 Tax=Planktothrix tepida PCC 9214 TaxID=671072 RepID=A0A1J1LNI5_9CYAN|nr:AAA-like domain-containing protein [Planktothrix tepida]CAD5940583.1 putative WD repeat-containing protein slr0143 [Planktothrix tepida]CUR33145.1 conserved hypothetical protein [Planktothrix tepida PCC 9214]
MDAKVALEWVDQLVFEHQGKHLNDLEREVFLGSWDGKSYLEIYPLNPTYIEKYVGYKLWQKISQALGDKVTKKTIRGAVERYQQKENIIQSSQISGELLQLSTPVYRVFVSHGYAELNLRLAQQLEAVLTQVGNSVFLAAWEVIRSPLNQQDSDFLAQIDKELKQCDAFILLLSPQSSHSEMVIEELRQVRELQDTHPHRLPKLIPIWVNCPANLPLNHDLRSYLWGTMQYTWSGQQDTVLLLQKILSVFQELIHESPPQYSPLDWDKSELENQPNLVIQSHKSPSISSLSIKPFYSSVIPSPFPVAEPELPSGQVRLESAFYIKRVPHEDQCYQEISHPGALIRLKAPRQMGKTSLMARILEQGREQGYRAVPLSFQHADKTIFTNLNHLLQWLCSKVTRKLKLAYHIPDYWSNTFGSKDNCTAYFEDYLLSQSDQPLVLGLDEVDRVFQYPNIADDFFSLLRAWYEEANYGGGDSELWEKLRLVIVHSTEVYIPLDINQSPFNVGLPIELTEFTATQVEELAQRHGLNWGGVEVETLMRLVGGHPYLVRVALYHLVQYSMSLDQFAEIAPTEGGIYSDHLRRHLWNLQQHPQLAEAFYQVVCSSQPVELESILAFKLHSLGLVHLQGNEVTPRFQLYQNYFGRRLKLKP